MENLVLKNIDVYKFFANEYPNKNSFEKLSRNSVVCGSIQYWIYKANNQFSKIIENIQKARENLLTEYAEKDKDGSPKKIYEYGDNQKLYEEEIVEKNDEEITKISEKYCMKFPNGAPMIMFHFEDEALKKLNEELEKLMNAENTFTFHKINISSKDLEMMNKSKKVKNQSGQTEEVSDPITIQDMENLSLIIEFVE